MTTQVHLHHVTDLVESNGDLIQYRIPRSSIQTFASRKTTSEADSLAAPSFGPDMIMVLLSGAARSLISNNERCSETIAEYFALSFYSHLFDRYGVKSADEERFVGGLSPRHKRVIHEFLSPPFGPTVTIVDVAS